MDRPVPPYLLELVSGPAVPLVSTADAKLHCRIDHADEDALISALALAAGKTVQEQVGKALVTQSWKITLASIAGTQRLWLPVFPVQSITSIAYFDADNTGQTATLSDFGLHGDEDHAWIEPKTGKTWPALYPRPDALAVTFVAGFGAAASDVPDHLILATRMLIAHWYENREAAAGPLAEIPLGVQQLTGLSRKGWFA